MSKITWTEEMLGILTERFPTESNSTIADELGVCRRCVASKAKELGLEKDTVRSREEAIRIVVENYSEKSYADLAKLANVSRRTVQRIVAEKGLKRKPEEISRFISRRRIELIRRERRRITFGLPPVSNMKVVSNVHRIRLRHRLKKAGYTVIHGSNIIYYTEEIKRSPVREFNGARLGLIFMPYPEQEAQLLTAII